MTISENFYWFNQESIEVSRQSSIWKLNEFSFVVYVVHYNWYENFKSYALEYKNTEIISTIN